MTESDKELIERLRRERDDAIHELEGLRVEQDEDLEHAKARIAALEHVLIGCRTHCKLSPLASDLVELINKALAGEGE